MGVGCLLEQEATEITEIHYSPKLPNISIGIFSQHYIPNTFGTDRSLVFAFQISLKAYTKFLPLVSGKESGEETEFELVADLQFRLRKTTNEGK